MVEVQDIFLLYIPQDVSELSALELRHFNIVLTYMYKMASWFVTRRQMGVFVTFSDCSSYAPLLKKVGVYCFAHVGRSVHSLHIQFVERTPPSVFDGFNDTWYTSST